MAAAKGACPSCGVAKNSPGATRCVSCGAKLEALPGKIQRSREEELERRYNQEGMSVQWLFIAFAVQTVLTAALVFGLPMVLTAIDFEGGNGMTVCVPVWFLGGLLVGMISPGRTFIEPVVASFIVAIPTTFFLVQSQTVRTMPTFLYVIMASIGVLFTLIGAYIGERIQLGPPPKTGSFTRLGPGIASGQLEYPIAPHTQHGFDLADAAAESILTLDGLATFHTVASTNNIQCAHPLASCRIGDHPGTSALDDRHELRGHPGIFVTDGASVPTSLCVNPSLTIAALAERASSLLLERADQYGVAVKHGGIPIPS